MTAVVERASFEEWVRPHLGAMARLAERLAPGDGDDVVQDALTRAWRRWETFDAGRGTPRTWLLAIVADRARRTRLRRRVTVPLVDDVAEPAREGDVALEGALRRLPRRQRLAVALHYFTGLSVAECAVVMGCAEGTVKSTLHDARRRLREELGDD
ncbi:MAG TPA: RNA polymerase sigma factor [Frankiaceae bacterium]|jgi:RNA polymerase sigma-70 factor (ECF subfamily)|nr:RNA polymerase sigma factor [Frankiaceae bacterium]